MKDKDAPLNEILRDVAANNTEIYLFEQQALLEAAERLVVLEAALRTIQSAVPKYLKKEMTAEEFALVVIGEVDSGRVNRALEDSR